MNKKASKLTILDPLDPIRLYPLAFPTLFQPISKGKKKKNSYGAELYEAQCEQINNLMNLLTHAAALEMSLIVLFPDEDMQAQTNEKIQFIHLVKQSQNQRIWFQSLHSLY